MTSGPRFVASALTVRVPVSVSEVGTMEDSRRPVTEEPVTADTEDVQPGPRAPIDATGRDRDAERVDAIAGSEFLDDRIRLRD